MGGAGGVGGGGGGRAGRGFLLHWGGAKTKGLFFNLARRSRPLADMSPARVGFNAPSSKNSRLIFAQQPRPNGQKKSSTPRPADGGHDAEFYIRALLATVRGWQGRARSSGRGREGSGFRVQEKPNSRRASALNERSYRTAEQPHGRTRTARRGAMGRDGGRGGHRGGGKGAGEFFGAYAIAVLRGI